MNDFDPYAFLRDVVNQNAGRLKRYFASGAEVFWHNTGERFTVLEYIRANCEYPGDWDGIIERTEQAGKGLVIVAKVSDDKNAFRAVSFIQLEDGKITRLDEYWGDCGDPPDWRKKLGLGRAV